MAFTQLTRQKLKHKKVKKLLHNYIKMADYLEPSNVNFTQSEAKLLFRLKSKMVDVKANFPRAYNNNINCTLCEKEGKIRKDTQKHIIICPVIKRKNSEEEVIKYKYLKSESLEDKIKLVKCIKKKLIIRKHLIENMNEPK